MLFFDLLQQLALFLLIAYLFSKSPAFLPLVGELLLIKHKLIFFLIFSGFTLLGSHVGPAAYDSLQNAATIGIVSAGLLAGPVFGLTVGLTGGLYGFLLSGFAGEATPYIGSSMLLGLFAGQIHLLLVKRNKTEQLFSPLIALLTTLTASILQLLVVVLLIEPRLSAQSASLGQSIPLLVINALGAALFTIMLRDRKTMFDKVGTMYSAKTLNIAERSLGIFGRGFNESTAQELAEIIYEETGVGAVGISDREKYLAFIGEGDDHHLPGLKIISPQTIAAIRENRIIYADGVKERFTCALSPDCPLGSALIVPLRVDNDVVGTIKLYEPKNRLFLSLNKTLGEGITRLLSEQLLRYRYLDQKNLLTKSELKLIQAQVNPHFLFNALNTIVSVVRKNPDQARSLLLHLSNYFRKNLKRSNDLATLAEELDHVNSYLVIQEARFGAKLRVERHIDPQLLKTRVPTFTLQPIVENAVKHGISNMLEAGTVKISARRETERIVIEVEDDAGAYCEKLNSDGLGMNIVDKRIKALYGNRFGTEISCVPDVYTRVSLILPCEKD